MSYILDALKRADAERERGAVPGLHARPLTTPSAHTAPAAQSRLWLLMAAALALCGIAAGLWVWRTPTGAAPLAAVAVDETKLATVAPLAPPAATPIPGPARAEPAPLPVAPPVRLPAPSPAVVTVAPATNATKTTARTAPPLAKASATPIAPPAVPLLGELPEDIRRQIPPLALTGSVYAQSPGQRLLLVNNQVLGQGSVAAPDLKLEEIQPHNAVFNFKGTRFRVPH